MRNTPILITGCQRSGTTLLSLVLDSHPQVKGVDEVDFDRSKAAIYLNGPEYHSHVAFKLPDHAHRVESFAALDKGRIIWCQRDPRAVVASMLALNLRAQGRVMPWAQHPIGAQLEIEHGLVAMSRYGRRLPSALLQDYVHLRAMPAEMRGRGEGLFLAALCWRIKQELLMAYQTLVMPLYILRYESLIGDKEGEMQRILDFLELEWHQDVLQHHSLHEGISTGLTDNKRPIDTRSLEKWKRQLTVKELEQIRLICEEAASLSGYTLENS